MNLVGEVTLGSLLSGANLLLASGFIWRVAVWKTKLETERKAEAKALVEWKASTTDALAHITTKLGNGTPGQVVLLPTCERLHGAVEREIATLRDVVNQNGTATREDIRSLHAALAKREQGGAP